MGKGGYVYILANERLTVLYVGVTSDLEQRVLQHRSGLIKGFTWRYNLCRLLYYEEHGKVEDAIRREKQIKGWTRSKKEALIDRVNPERRDLAPEA